MSRKIVSRNGNLIHENAYAAAAPMMRGRSVEGTVMTMLLTKLDPICAFSRTRS
jgi:hypothetical protein